MFTLLTYDIDQTDGGKRLRKVAKTCEGYGIRVQNSVFEMEVSIADLIVLKKELENIIDKDKDSIRIYKIGKKKNASVTVIGHMETIEITKNHTVIL